MKDNSKLSRYASIFDDVKASDIMTSQVATLAADMKIAHAQEMMKIKKISGIPVIGDQNKLVGIISIEDIIKALELGRINEPIRNVMTRNVVTMGLNENFSQIVDKFENFKFGRFPVIDGEGQVLGIVTKEDILHGIIEKFNLIYIHDKQRSARLDADISIITGEQLKIDEAKFHYSIETTDIGKSGSGASLLKQFLKEKKFASEMIRRVAVATYEAETNVVIHSKGKGEILCFIDEDRIIVRVVDNGVGIEDLDKAMREGYSTAPDYVREYGFGAGMGIPNMKRSSDKLVILSKKEIGTQVEMVFYLQGLEVRPEVVMGVS
jgi:anti-sigma regulatory factor (Ser/Thr protein kinase)/CBS domain-containing protein